MSKEEFINTEYPYPEPCEECGGTADIMIGTGKDFFVWFWCEKCEKKHGCINGKGDINIMHDKLEAKARARRSGALKKVVTWPADIAGEICPICFQQMKKGEEIQIDVSGPSVLYTHESCEKWLDAGRPCRLTGDNPAVV